MLAPDGRPRFCPAARTRMEGLWCLFQILLVLPAAVRTWDVMVARDGHLTTLTADGSSNDMQTELPLGASVSMAMAPAFDKVYLGDGSHPNASVFRLDVESGRMVPVVPKQSGVIKSLALDPMHNVLYWTTGYSGHSIMKANVDGLATNKEVKVVHRFREEIPQGIAIDSCGRYLFWTNTFFKAPSIERSNLDGSNRTVIVSKDLYQPLGVAVDQAERKLYWSQQLEGLYYSIERSDLDGSNREVMRSMHHEPYSLAVGLDYIYWADLTNNDVWKKAKSLLLQGSEPIKVHRFTTQISDVVAYVAGEAKTDVECRAILTAFETRKMEATTIVTTAATEDIIEADWNDNKHSDEFCLNDGAVLISEGRGPVCRCLPGFTGVRCETEICFNYCVHGTCAPDNKRGGPACSCAEGYTGLRCEQSVCSEFCLNGGHCSVVEGQPTCDCHETFKGDRCEISSSVSKLCQLYCESDLATVPLHSGSESKPLCVCPPLEKHKYGNDGHNETAHSVSSQMYFKNDASLMDGNGSALVIAFGCICLLLLLLVVLLMYKVVQLRKRPRVKKRFIGSKTVTPTPLTNRPSPATDQCEINIENCCNMNICETPCFEPNIRTARPGSKKEEKKTLLDSMETAQGKEQFEQPHDNEGPTNSATDINILIP